MMAGRFRALMRSTRGGVALIGALSLTVLIGMGAFAIEATQGYAVDTQNQRVADMAALAGALAYNVNSSSSQMTATAKAVVAAQGLPASAATGALVTDAASGKQLVQVTVTTAVPLALGRVFTAALSYDVTAVGSATTTSMTTTAPPCIAALSSTPTYGITLDGGVSITSPGCAINTNAGVTVPWGTHITAKQVNAGKTINNPGSGITTSPTAGDIHAGKASAATDWMSGDAGLLAMLCKVNQLTGYSDPDYADGNRTCTTPLVTATSPTVAGSPWTLGYNEKKGPGIDQYQTANYSCQYNIPADSYTIGKLTVPGGCSISFADGSTLKFASIDMSGNGMTIGNGDVTVAGDFGFNSGSVITIGNGSHSFGSLRVTGGRTMNIGSGDLNITGGVRVDGGSYLYVTSIAGDRITIGRSSGGRAIEVAGGSKVCFTASCATPTAAVTTFSLDGIVETAGGSTILFPKAATHVINGDLDLEGSSIFGAGTYIIKGFYSNNTGGTMSGADVSFALGGMVELSGGTSLDLAAPGASSSFGVPGVLIASKTVSDTKFGGGSANKYAGLIYLPKSKVLISGGASVSAAGSACMMMIVNVLEVKGGGTLNSGSCSSLSTSGPTASVALFK